MSRQELPPLRINNLTRPFWEAARKGVLSLQLCKKCHTFQWYPRAWCVNCGSRELEWTGTSGRGTVYSFTMIHHTRQNPAFAGKEPYNIILVELDEGPRMYGNLVGCRNDEIRIGMRVEATFERVNDEFVHLKFKPERSGSV